MSYDWLVRVFFESLLEFAEECAIMLQLVQTPDRGHQGLKAVVEWLIGFQDFSGIVKHIVPIQICQGQMCAGLSTDSAATRAGVGTRAAMTRARMW